MSEPLTEQQLNVLQKERDGFVNGAVQYRGLVARGLLAYRWGNDHSFGRTR